MNDVFHVRLIMILIYHFNLNNYPCNFDEEGSKNLITFKHLKLVCVFFNGMDISI
jgi:hypothetical protein